MFNIDPCTTFSLQVLNISRNREEFWGFDFLGSAELWIDRPSSTASEAARHAAADARPPPLAAYRRADWPVVVGEPSWRPSRPQFLTHHQCPAEHCLSSSPILLSFARCAEPHLRRRNPASSVHLHQISSSRASFTPLNYSHDPSQASAEAPSSSPLAIGDPAAAVLTPPPHTPTPTPPSAAPLQPFSARSKQPGKLPIASRLFPCARSHVPPRRRSRQKSRCRRSGSAAGMLRRASVRAKYICRCASSRYSFPWWPCRRRARCRLVPAGQKPPHPRPWQCNWGGPRAQVSGGGSERPSVKRFSRGFFFRVLDFFCLENI
jgi:hypothetical protein